VKPTGTRASAVAKGERQLLSSISVDRILALVIMLFDETMPSYVTVQNGAFPLEIPSTPTFDTLRQISNWSGAEPGSSEDMRWR
jgi:hypothetical protein